MRLIIRDDKGTASKHIADYIIERIKGFAPTPEKPFVLGLPTGSSPEGIYKHLVAAYKHGDISFKDIVTFNMVRLIVAHAPRLRADGSRTNTSESRASTLSPTTRSCTNTFSAT